jgi:hypothetical protein
VAVTLKQTKFKITPPFMAEKMQKTKWALAQQNNVVWAKAQNQKCNLPPL